MFARDVPQRQVDPADRLNDNAATPVKRCGGEKLFPNCFDVERVHTREQILQMVFDDVTSCAAAAAHSVSGDALIGLNADQDGAVEL